eukprot:6207807-Pleurochrysis_carterae.AAC.1
MAIGSVSRHKTLGFGPPRSEESAQAFASNDGSSHHACVGAAPLSAPRRRILRFCVRSKELVQSRAELGDVARESARGLHLGEFVIRAEIERDVLLRNKRDRGRFHLNNLCFSGQLGTHAFWRQVTHARAGACGSARVFARALRAPAPEACACACACACASAGVNAAFRACACARAHDSLCERVHEAPCHPPQLIRQDYNPTF